MGATVIDSRIFGNLFGTDAMRRVWSDENRTAKYVEIERALEGTAAVVECPGTLDLAVTRAIQLAKPGDAVVLSPACASLDQFANYVERGERYTRRVLAQLAEDAHA